MWHWFAVYFVVSCCAAGVLCFGIDRWAKSKQVDWTNENRGAQRW